MAASSIPPPTDARRNDATGSITVQKQSQSQDQNQEAIQDNHPLGPEPDSTGDSRMERTGKSRLNSLDRDACQDNSGISVISSVAIDGQVQQFENSITPQRWKLVVGGRRIPRRLESRARALEVIAAYKMMHVQTSNRCWQDYIIPWHNMRVSEFLRTGDDLCDGGTKASTGASPPDHNEGDGIERTQTQKPPVDPPVGSPGDSSSSPSPGAPQSHLEFAARRNLEHILSVCAVQTISQTLDNVIPIATPFALQDVEAVALTCGDMSGHRICWSASL